MSEFEYVSVAVALVYSLAVARIVGALPSVTAESSRYWVHTLWTLVLLLATISTWWTIWNLREVEWNSLRFMWVLSIPALIHLRVAVLVSENPAEVESWRAHYYEKRVQFFGVGLVIAANFAVLPWLMGVVPWFSMSPFHWTFASLMIVSVSGLASANAKLHAALASVNFVMILVGIIAASR